MSARSPSQRTAAYRDRQRTYRSTPHGRATVGLNDARRRAKERGILFELVRVDVPDVPECCPACSTKMLTGPRPARERTHRGARMAGHCSPTLDRVTTSLGYVRGNVAWICNHCNAMKNGLPLSTLMDRANADGPRAGRYWLLARYVINHLVRKHFAPAADLVHGGHIETSETQDTEQHGPQT